MAKAAPKVIPPPKSSRTTLQRFLNSAENTKTRERIFFNRLYFDIKLAAARRGYALTVFEPEVDRDGFDLVLDDADTTRHIQLKSATRSSKTNRWRTTPRFLRPTILTLEHMGFESSPHGEGLGGGVILILIDDDDHACAPAYFYTDLYVLAMLARGFLRQVGKSRRRVQQVRRQQAQTVLTALYRERDRNADLVLPKGIFLKAKSPDAILTMAGLHSINQRGHSWSSNLMMVYRNHFEADDVGEPASTAPKQIVAHAHAAASQLHTLIAEPGLDSFNSGITDFFDGDEELL